MIDSLWRISADEHKCDPQISAQVYSTQRTKDRDLAISLPRDNVFMDTAPTDSSHSLCQEDHRFRWVLPQLVQRIPLLGESVSDCKEQGWRGAFWSCPRGRSQAGPRRQAGASLGWEDCQAALLGLISSAPSVHLWQGVILGDLNSWSPRLTLASLHRHASQAKAIMSWYSEVLPFCSQPGA